MLMLSLLGALRLTAQEPSLPFFVDDITAYVVDGQTIPVMEKSAEYDENTNILFLYLEGEKRNQHLSFYWNGRIGKLFVNRYKQTITGINVGGITCFLSDNVSLEFAENAPLIEAEPLMPNWFALQRATVLSPDGSFISFEPQLKKWFFEDWNEVYNWKGSHRHMEWNPTTGQGVLHWRTTGPKGGSFSVPFRFNPDGTPVADEGYTVLFDFTEAPNWAALKDVVLDPTGYVYSTSTGLVPDLDTLRFTPNQSPTISFRGTERQGWRWEVSHTLMYAGEPVEFAGWIKVLINQTSTPASRAGYEVIIHLKNADGDTISASFRGENPPFFDSLEFDGGKLTFSPEE